MGGCVGVEKPLEDGYTTEALAVVFLVEEGIEMCLAGLVCYLIAPSNVPGRKPNPCPISCRNRSPSTSLSSATSTLH